MFTKPFKTGMSLDLARGPDFQRMTKGTPGDEVGHNSSCYPILSLIIFVTNISDSHCAVVRFCGHSYDSRWKLTLLSPIRVTYGLLVTSSTFYFVPLL